LKQRFQYAIYDPSKFPGVVIHLNQLEQHFKGHTANEKYEFTENYIDPDDDNIGDDADWLDAIKETNEYETYKMHNRQNAKFLVFPQGHVICTGCKSERELLHAYYYLFLLLDRCREDDSHNQCIENSLKSRIG
jgi:TATA-box binding protein (TBP) (component of TFIID and TFIIIB)